MGVRRVVTGHSAEGKAIVASHEVAGLAAHMEPDHPGMHTTSSVDYEFAGATHSKLDTDR